MSLPSPAANATASAAILANIGNITGPMLLGHLFNWALLGVLALQVYIYSISFGADKIGIKILVYFLFFLDILQTAFTTHYAWYVLAGGWGHLSALNVTPWTLATIPPVGSLIALLVQGFFSRRIWVLADGNELYYIPVLSLIGVTAFGSCIAAWYAGIVSAKLHNVSEASVLDPEVTGWLAGSVACDAMITITLVWQLSRRRNQGFRTVNYAVHRAIRMAIETGALTTIVTSANLGLYLNSSLTNWYFLLGMWVAKLYSNSLLATLNARSSTFQKPGLSSTSGVHVWEFRPREIRGNTTITTSFGDADTQRNDVELDRIQNGKPQDLIPDSSAFPA